MKNTVIAILCILVVGLCGYIVYDNTTQYTKDQIEHFTYVFSNLSKTLKNKMDELDWQKD